MEPSSQVIESDEQKYVTLETGSKLSGYTQDYLERLCRLKKVEYRIWNNGQFVIELGSLLQETQTILLSHDGISFVDKGELADPVPEVVGSMLSSALKEVKTDVAMPDAPIVPMPTVVETTIMPPEVVAPIPVAVSEVIVPVIANSALPQSLPEKVEQSALPAAIPHIPMSAPAVPVPLSAPMATQGVGRMPIKAVAPQVIPTPPRPIKINTAVESVLAKPSVATPVPSPVVETPTPASALTSVAPIASPAEISLPPLEQKELPVIPAPIENNISVAATVTPVSVKQSIPFGSLPEQVVLAKEEVVTKESFGDDWDALLLGGAPVVIESPAVSAPVPKEALPVASIYHPIQTSIDPRPHYDDAPLFPVLNPSGVVRPADVREQTQVPPPPVTPVLSTPAPASETHGSNQRVVVYAPGDLLVDKPVSAAVPGAPVSPLSIPKKQGVINHEPLPVPSSEISHATPIVPTAIIRKNGDVPALRVMPSLPAMPQNNLPMRAEEHHLSVQEEHSLMKSPVLNLAFAAVVIGSSLLLFDSTFSGVEKKLSNWGSTSYVAGVGAAFTGDTPVNTSSIPKKANELSLPFSDEVIVDPGSKPNSVIVRPVFRTGPGNSYEYAITQITATSSTAR